MGRTTWSRRKALSSAQREWLDQAPSSTEVTFETRRTPIRRTLFFAPKTKGRPTQSSTDFPTICTSNQIKNLAITVPTDFICSSQNLLGSCLLIFRGLTAVGADKPKRLGFCGMGRCA